MSSPAPRTLSAAEHARFRQRCGAPDVAVLEGFHALKHALRFGAQIELALTVDPDAVDRTARDLAPDLRAALGRLLRVTTPDMLEELAPHTHHTGVVALATKPTVVADDVLRSRLDRPAVLLEDPRNLGNVGAVIRVAAAADAAGVMTTGTHDPWDPSAIRGSAGLHFALPVLRIPALAVGSRPLVALDPDGEDLRSAALPPGALLAFGTERHGLTDALLDRADLRLRIPMRRGVSSLNLATSVAAVLFGLAGTSGSGSWS